MTIALVIVLLFNISRFAGDAPALLLLMTAILVAGGNAVVTGCLYVLGAYVGRAYLETKGRPPYVILQVVEGAPGARASDSRGS